MQMTLTHDGDKIIVNRATDLAQFPTSSLIDNFNTLNPSKPVNKFADRKTAEKRLWAALQAHYAADTTEPLGTAGEATQDQVTEKKAKVKKVKAEKAPKVDKPRAARAKSFNLPPKDEQRMAAPTTKRGKLIQMMRDRDGMTYAEVQTEIGWSAKDAYEGIRLCQVACGWALSQGGDGKIRLLTTDEWKAMMAKRKTAAAA